MKKFLCRVAVLVLTAVVLSATATETETDTESALASEPLLPASASASVSGPLLPASEPLMKAAVNQGNPLLRDLFYKTFFVVLDGK
jgi:hypothetical protein